MTCEGADRLSKLPRSPPKSRRSTRSIYLHIYPSRADRSRGEPADTRIKTAFPPLPYTHHTIITDSSRAGDHRTAGMHISGLVVPLILVSSCPLHIIAMT